MDQKLNIKERLLCSQCLEQEDTNQQIMSVQEIIDQIEKQFQIRQKQLFYQIQQKTTLLDKIAELILQTQNAIIKNLSLINTNVLEWKQSLNELKCKSFEYSLIQELHSLKYSKIQNIQCSNSDILFQINIKHQQQLEQLMQNYINASKFDQLQLIFQQLIHQNKTKQKLIIKQELKSLIQIKNKKINAFEFNFDGTFLITLSNKCLDMIDISNNFQTYSIDKIQEYDFGNILSVSKNQNLIMTSSENKVLVYQQENIKWLKFEPLVIHSKQIIFISLNSTEDEIITSSYQESIAISKIDEKQKKLIFLYFLSQNAQIYQISINQQKTMILQFQKGLIKLWKYNQKWFVSQEIKRLNQFEIVNAVFLANNNILLRLIDLSTILLVLQEKEIQFYKTKEIEAITQGIKIKFNFYPCLYNMQKDLYVQKYNNQYYILKNKEKFDFEIWDDSINCENINSMCSMSIDGTKFVILEENNKLKFIDLIYDF